MKTLLIACLLVSRCALAQLDDVAFVGSLTTTATASIPAIQTIITSTNAIPSITNLTIASGNAIRVWTGETPHSEPGFNLYYRLNGGTVYTVRMYRWQGRILNASAGDAIILGTDDGRAVQVAEMTAPAALISPSGANGVVNCDKAGPPIWSPTAAHITLPSANNAFSIDLTNTERIVFVSEYDGTTWSYPRWLWVQTNYAVSVQCTYAQVALANYDGAAIGITAPAGTTIGGSSATMTLGLPAITGTSNYCTTVAQFQTAISNSVSGDGITLAAGTYAMTTNIVAASFSANNGVGGKVGAEGITISGATGIRSDVVITGVEKTNCYWNLTQSGASGLTCFKDVTFNFANIAGGFQARGGKWRFENVRWTGPGTNTVQSQFYAESTAAGSLTIDMLFCQSDNATNDNISFSANAAHVSDSSVRVISCTSTNSGNASAYQNITTHVGLPIYVYGGKYGDAHSNFSANDNDSSVTYLNFITCDPGLRTNRFNHSALYGCYIVSKEGTSAIATNRYSLFTRYIMTNAVSSQNVLSPKADTVISHNRMWGNGGRAYRFAGTAVNRFDGNIIDKFDVGFRFADYSSGTKTNIFVLNNDFLNSITTGLDAVETTGGTELCLATNNAFVSNAKSVNATATSKAYLLSDYNVLDATVDTDYTVGPNDIQPADAALSAAYLPTASGNCDGNGLANAFGWVGDSDPFGFVFIYLPTRMSRGAREIPAIYANSILYPDFY